jgi:hypothetical protein
MSNRRISQLSDLVNRLAFFTEDPFCSDLDQLIQSAFQLRLLRWLQGNTHPVQLKGTFIDDDTFDALPSGELARARILLRAMSDSDLIPLNPLFRLKVRSPFPS